jgi:hypothetical protein
MSDRQSSLTLALTGTTYKCTGIIDHRITGSLDSFVSSSVKFIVTCHLSRLSGTFRQQLSTQTLTCLNHHRWKRISKCKIRGIRCRNLENEARHTVSIPRQVHIESDHSRSLCSTTRNNSENPTNPNKQQHNSA